MRIDGHLAPGVTAKDIILALIAKIGVEGGTGHVFEYSGSAIRSLNMEERMTVCNMTIEGGARAGMIAPDDVTFQYLADNLLRPSGRSGRTLERWRSLPTDEGAIFDKTISLGRHKSRADDHLRYPSRDGHAGITDAYPTPTWSATPARKPLLPKRWIIWACNWHACWDTRSMRFSSAVALTLVSPISAAASLMKDRKVAPGLRVLVVPGSHSVKRQAEAEGLDRIFQDAGADWRQPGCSMCIAMNGDQLSRANMPSAPATGTSRAGKGKAGALSWPARSPPRRPPDRKNHGREGDYLMAQFTILTARGCPPGRQYRYRPDHPGALPEDDE